MLRLPLSLNMATSPLLTKPRYGTKNLSKGAKSRVRVFADIQNFALHCMRTTCTAFPLKKKLYSLGDPVQASRFGRLDGGRGGLTGQKNCLGFAYIFRFPMKF